MSNTRMFALACALAFGMACSAVLDFELEVECWCGERWLVQIAGAEAIRLSGAREVIPTGATTHERCVTQLEHLALSQAQPADSLGFRARPARRRARRP